MIKVTPQITHHGGYSIEALRKAFEGVQDKDHWKNPIRAEISKRDIPILRVAIPFYTSTIPFFYDLGNGVVVVKAAGYKLGPANII